VLFVGESPPANGKFFCCGNNALVNHMRSAVGGAGGADREFLEGFKATGWYLDDLVQTPIDNLPTQERKRRCEGARHDLALRIAEYRPRAIVSLLRRIKDDVEAAAKEAGSNAARYNVPFPGHGNQGRFLAEMRNIVPKLPGQS
jgi:hypothetical protein